MQKTIFFLVLCLILLGSSPAVAAPGITGKSAVLIDVVSGQVLYEQDKDAQLPPASTTKILTAIMAIESGKMEEVVSVGENPPLVEGTRVYLEKGEKVKLENLVKAALIHSANDAALAIAEYLAGSKEEFAKLMNAKAHEIGVQNSNFINPHGLSEEGHYTSAYDLALIGRYAMKNDVFKEIVQEKVLDWEGQAWQTRLININKLLWSYDGADGIKTGYTTEARYTIVASATREDRTYIAVVLGSSGNAIYDEAGELLDYGFQNFQKLELADVDRIAATVNLEEGEKLDMVPGKSFSLSINQEDTQKVEPRLVLKVLPKKIEKGQVVGEMVFFIEDKEVGRVDLLAHNDVSATFNYFNLLLYTASGLFFLQVLWRSYLMYSRKRRRRRGYGLGSYHRSY